MNLKEILNWRYSTKEFDSNKKISTEDFEQVKTLLQMSPSSTNIQPWHFVIASTEEGKERIAKGTQGFYQFNEPKVKDASHVIVFCSRTDADEKYMQHLLDTEDKDGRFPNEEIKQMTNGGRNIFANMHRYDFKDLQHWMEKQVYLNIGNLLLGVATLGIDALPMEGVDLKVIDEEFSLREKGFTAVAVVSLGYRTETDFNTTDKTPKSRLSQEEIFTLLK
ncbi:MULTISPECIES: oxygen-insensitive NAD(P)H nitroreductase [unclassified Lentimicrobium]|uniref:oxygen-insensitive NAD(P)H nitroreductase n=1 Tax=unclassified Lentimicrobium TaxID=2677434 RepID=UPI0015534198|nr:MULTISPECIES: oxygen-insensitive NAD(P)H nitroreductase [unclassified Lentimicrobium]NPD46939.1 oxygen-insensitive NAD(P)H nitroreductase [Lentimicrobium sp. S6]NPD84142.1 oxygen-insensitive NAD(P)H nitroreductase [Lentimicrobium sp. L6]